MAIDLPKDYWTTDAMTSIPRKCGIYCFRHVNSGREYIGSAVDLYARARKHRTAWRAGKHHSIFLQRCIHKYGESAFVFFVLEYLDSRNDLIKREQFWIDTRRPCLNYQKVAGSSLGRIYSEESRRKMSESAKRRANTPEHKAKYSLVHKGKKQSAEMVAKVRRRMKEERERRYIESGGLFLSL